jgi:hypothetical protein
LGSELLKPLGFVLPVFPLRGQVFSCMDPPRVRHILLLRLFTGTRRGGVYVGSTLEKAGFERSVTPEGIATLAKRGQAMAPDGAVRVSGYFRRVPAGVVGRASFLGACRAFGSF